MSKRFLVGATAVALAAGVGAGGMAAAGATSTKAHAAGERLTINGSPFGASLVSSPNLQIKNGVIVAKVKAARKGWDGTVKGNYRITVTIPGSAATTTTSTRTSTSGCPSCDGDIIFGDYFTIKPGQTKTVTIPTTFDQRHAINTKGTGGTRFAAVIGIEFDTVSSGGNTTTYRTEYRSASVTLVKKSPAVSLTSSRDLVVQTPTDGGLPFLRATLLCAGNEVDNQACAGTVKVTVSGSTTVPTSPYSAPPGVPTVVDMAINEKGLPGTKTNIKKGTSNAKIIVTTTGGSKKEYVGHVTLIKQ